MTAREATAPTIGPFEPVPEVADLTAAVRFYGR